MDVTLLDRSGRAMTLTPEGQALAFSLGQAFDDIAQTVAALTGAGADRPLQIACTPTFAANWLMPRLPRFRARHPDLELMVNPSHALTDPEPGGIDVALRYGTGPWPGLRAEPLVPAPLVVVGAPGLFGSDAPVRADDLLALPWLQEIGTTETSRWFEERGLKGRRPAAVTHLPGNLVLDGLRAGQGVAILTRTAVALEIEAGLLRVLFEDDTGAWYHVVTRPEPPRAPLRSFLRWIRSEAADAAPAARAAAAPPH